MPDFRHPITTNTARGSLLSLLLLPALLHAASISVDGSGDTFGALPVVTYGLAEQTATGEDILPSGPNGFFLFGLFDTGSTGVAINADGTNFFFGADDATNLGIAGTRTVDVRVNGLGATTQAGPTTVTAPIGAPGSGFEPEASPWGPRTCRLRCLALRSPTRWARSLTTRRPSRGRFRPATSSRRTSR